jgi:hypothetical protein
MSEEESNSLPESLSPGPVTESISGTPRRRRVPRTEGPSQEAERIWSLGLHVDSLFIQRGNFYLLGHSMFVVAYAAVLTGGFSSSTHHAALSWVARVLAGFGLLLAFVWLYVSHVQWTYLKFLRSRSASVIPSYEQIRGNRPQLLVEDGPISAYVVPIMAAVMWVVLMLLA